MARILVVDDDEFYLRASSRLLTQHNHEVVYCQSGTEALQIIINNSGYQAYVFDNYMPAVGGIDLVKEVRKSDLITPIIVFSSDILREDEGAFLAAGADLYVLKGEAVGNLVCAVEALLARSITQIITE